MTSRARNVMVLCGYANMGAAAGRSRTDSTKEAYLIVALGRLAENTSRAL